MKGSIQELNIFSFVYSVYLIHHISEILIFWHQDLASAKQSQKMYVIYKQILDVEGCDL